MLLAAGGRTGIGADVGAAARDETDRGAELPGGGALALGGPVVVGASPDVAPGSTTLVGAASLAAVRVDDADATVGSKVSSKPYDAG